MHPVSIRMLPGWRVAGLSHLGPYGDTGAVFARLRAILAAAGPEPPPGEWAMITHDNPDLVPAPALRSFAGVLLPEGARCPRGLEETRLSSGRHAVLAHKGPYETLPAAYRDLFGRWMAAAGERPGPGPTFEIYRNHPERTLPEELRTDVCVPLA